LPLIEAPPELEMKQLPAHPSRNYIFSPKFNSGRVAHICPKKKDKKTI
jgi:hypothetical protein